MAHLQKLVLAPRVTIRDNMVYLQSETPLYLNNAQNISFVFLCDIILQFSYLRRW